METLGNRLRMVRLSFTPHVSIEKFAEMVGTTRSAYNEYEQDRSKPRDTLLQLISYKYHISLEWLRTGAGEMREPTDSEIAVDLAKKYALTPEQVKILNLLLGMPEEKRSACFDAFIALADAIRSQVRDQIFTQMQNQIDRMRG